MKKFLALVLALICVLSLAACGTTQPVTPTESNTNQSSEKPEPQVTDKNDISVSDDQSQSTESEVVEEYSKHEKVAIAFVDAIMDGKFDDAVAMLDVKDKTFLRGEDLKWYLSRTDYDELVETHKELVSHEESGSKTDMTVTLDYGVTKVSINVVMDENNEFKIHFDEWYIMGWNIRVAGQSKVSIADKEVDSSYFKEKTDNYYDIYEIPAIAKRTVKVKVENNFNVVEEEILPSLDEVKLIASTCPEDKREELMASTMKLLNSMYEAYESGKTTSDFVAFIDDELANPDLAAQLYESVSKSYYGSSSFYQPSKVSITEMKNYGDWASNLMFVATGENTILVTADFTKSFTLSQEVTSKTLSGQFIVAYRDGEMKFVKSTNDVTFDMLQADHY